MAIDISALKQKPQKGTSPGKKIQTTDDSFWKRDISFGKVLNDRRKEEFYTELVILLTAGLDLKASLDIIIKEQKIEKIRSIYKTISDCIIHGSSLSGAIELQKEFTAYEFYSLRIGEESGRMVEVMNELSAYFRKKIKQRKQLISAFSYPILIFFTAFVAVFFMLNFIVPLFADAFKRFNSELPALTQGVIALSEAFRKYWLVIPVAVILIIIAWQTYRKTEWYRKSAAYIILRLPIIGPLMQKVYLARFCQAMSLMTGARTPLIQALDLVSKMMGIYDFEVALAQIKDDLYHGKLLHESMAKFRIFETRMVSLIKVGEETNRLDSIFKRLYDQYTEESDHQTALMSSLLEPLLIILIGGMVAIILVAMYLPMFKLGSSIMGG